MRAKPIVSCRNHPTHAYGPLPVSKNVVEEPPVRVSLSYAIECRSPIGKQRTHLEPDLAWDIDVKQVDFAMRRYEIAWRKYERQRRDMQPCRAFW